MPRVKIDYVVSFSSEDPENQASNLLASEISKKRWLCSKGEPSCSVVLQLTKAVKINAVHIGAYHAALVEVLVGRSETPNDPFQVLVPSSVFVSPTDSRRDAPAERVRSFGAEQLAAGARAARWDRVRVVCSQPYNKHCKYGLTFVHINEPEGDPTKPTPAPEPKLAFVDRLLDLDAASSDEDDFRPGALFAKHRESGGNTSTDAQIRQATSQALKNIPDSSTKLTKTPIAKNKRHNTHTNVTNTQPDRQRTGLMYTDDDEQPHAKIDHVVNRHKDEKAKKADDERKATEEKDRLKRAKQQKIDESKRHDDSSSSKATKDLPKTPQTNTKDSSPSSSQSKGRERDRKRTHADDRHAKGGLRAGPVSSSPHTLLRGVVFVLSGYENPRRGALRDAALAMGARYERDWGARCTHLVCAFPNTPKLKTVRASPNGSAAIVVTGDWVEQCCARRRLLPWQWYATESKLKVAETLQTDDDSADSQQAIEDSDDDRAVQAKKRQRIDSSPRRRQSDGDSPSPRRRQNDSSSPHHRRQNDDSSDTPNKHPTKRSASPAPAADVSSGSDVMFVRDERVAGSVVVEDSDSDSTEPERAETDKCEVDDDSVLPDFFDGYTFGVDEGVAPAFDADLVRRYVRAYGGIVVEASQRDEDTTVDYWLCAGAGGTDSGAGAGRAVVRADWIWRCHEAKRLCPIGDYALTQ